MGKTLGREVKKRFNHLSTKYKELGNIWTFSLFKKNSGPIISLIVLAVLHYIYTQGGHITNTYNILVILVIYSIFAGGIVFGLLSGGIIISYGFIAYFFQGYPIFSCFSKNSNSSILNLIAFISIILISVLMKRNIEIETEKLKKSEERYRRLIEITPNAIITHNGEKITYANQSAVRLGMIENTEQIIGRDVSNFIHKDYQEVIRKRIENLQSEGGILPIIEEKIVLPNGAVIDAEVTATAISYEDKKENLVIIRDITQHKQTERVLRESTEHYRKLVEFLPEGIFMHDGENIIFTNKAGTEILGAENSNEIIGMAVFDIVHPDYHEVVHQLLKKAMKKNNLGSLVEEKLIRFDGTLVDVEAVTALFMFDGIEMFLTVVRDITTRKEAEELHRDMEEKKRQLEEALKYDRIRAEFFTNISHELRTPLNIIFSSIQLLETLFRNEIPNQESKKINKYIRIMKQNCYRQQRLVNNLIDITKIDAGYFQINLGNNDIVRTVEDITMSVKDYIEDKNITLQFDTNVEEKIIACDTDMIERIMLNLLSNALKFTDSGGQIMVFVKETKEKIIISVKDTGIGIPEDKIDMIFDRFVQVDRSTTRSHEGSGIGLSLVKSIVEMHNGAIHIKSEYGTGTEFIIELPTRSISDENNVVSKRDSFRQSPIESINLEFADIYSSN